jgi:hypothetical protein
VFCMRICPSVRPVMRARFAQILSQGDWWSLDVPSNVDTYRCSPNQIKSSLHEFGIHLFLVLYVPVGVFFLFEFCDVVTAQPSTRGKSQMWLQGCRRFLESCYVSVKSKNPVSKYGDIHVLLLRMWRTKRHLKKSCKCEISLHFIFFCCIVAYVLSYFMQFATSLESKPLDAMPWEDRDWWWIPTGVWRWWIQNNSWEAARDPQ